MSETITINNKEIKVLGSDDTWEMEGLDECIILRLNDMTYTVHTGFQNYVMHQNNGYCEFCERPIVDFTEDAFCTNELTTFEHLEKARGPLLSEWTFEKCFPPNTRAFEIIHEFSKLNTYHLVLKFNDNNKKVEVVLQVDEKSTIFVKEIKGSINYHVSNSIKGLILPELIEERRLDILTSCFPLTGDIVEYLLRKKCGDMVRYEILGCISSVFRMVGRNFSMEEEIQEILRCYMENENNDKETIEEIIKDSLIKIPH